MYRPLGIIGSPESQLYSFMTPHCAGSNLCIPSRRQLKDERSTRAKTQAIGRLSEPREVGFWILGASTSNELMLYILFLSCVIAGRISQRDHGRQDPSGCGLMEEKESLVRNTGINPRTKKAYRPVVRDMVYRPQN
ncbi:hypothetical protein B0J14DRAFT_561312 [Halenospora varia]|nr:hypothetical protein B0J14DRAFT_561312 [Halenospora varia]